MAEPLSDFSKIVELQEVKKLYDEQQERHLGDLAERDAEIERLRAELAAQSRTDGEKDALRAENERLGRQVQLVREEYESKIDRLNARIRDLSEGGDPSRLGGPPEPERRGFFRK